MKTSMIPVLAVSFLMLAGCAGTTTATPDTGSAGATPSPSSAGASHAAAAVQRGWYTDGTFRACGDARALRVDKRDQIDAQVRKSGMSAGDPVYVRLEGMAMADGFMLTRVAQVGSPTPVRDCPMTGTTTQVGG